MVNARREIMRLFILKEATQPTIYILTPGGLFPPPPSTPGVYKGSCLLQLAFLLFSSLKPETMKKWEEAVTFRHPSPLPYLTKKHTPLFCYTDSLVSNLQLLLRERNVTAKWKRPINSNSKIHRMVSLWHVRQYQKHIHKKVGPDYPHVACICIFLFIQKQLDLLSLEKKI